MALTIGFHGLYPRGEMAFRTLFHYIDLRRFCAIAKCQKQPAKEPPNFASLSWAAVAKTVLNQNSDTHAISQMSMFHHMHETKPDPGWYSKSWLSRRWQIRQVVPLKPEFSYNKCGSHQNWRRVSSGFFHYKGSCVTRSSPIASFYCNLQRTGRCPVAREPAATTAILNLPTPVLGAFPQPTSLAAAARGGCAGKSAGYLQAPQPRK